MAIESEIDLSERARSPANPFSIRTQNREFPTESLSNEEAEIFNEQFNMLINDLDSRLVPRLLEQRRNTIADVAGLARNQFDEKRFGGINAADNEIGFDVLRPGHIRADPEDGSSENTWEFEVSDGDDGWNDWIGDGSSDNNYTVSEDQVVLVLGFMEMSDNNGISAINVDEFGRNVDMIPKDLNDSRVPDNDNELQMQAIPTLVGTENDQIHVRLRADESGTYEPRLIGLTFGVGKYMNKEDY